MYTISAYFCYICGSFTTDYAKWSAIFIKQGADGVVCGRNGGCAKTGINSVYV